jgi:hypothetical protein
MKSRSQIVTNLYIQLDAAHDIWVLDMANLGDLCLRNICITERIIDKAQLFWEDALKRRNRKAVPQPGIFDTGQGYVRLLIYP